MTSNNQTVNIQQVAINAAYEGREDIMNVMIQKGANDFYEIAKAAAKGGHMQIVEDMEKRGAGRYEEFEQDISEAAVEGGHLDIVIKMLETGIMNHQAIAEFAAEKGHLDIVKYMVKKYPQYMELNSIRDWAEEGGHQHIVDWLSTLKTTTIPFELLEEIYGLK